MSSRKERKLQARASRLAREAELRAQESRKRLMRRGGATVAAAAAVGGAVIAIAVTGSGETSSARSSTTKPVALASLASLGALRSPGPLGPLGPESVPVPHAAELASAASATPATSVDGIECLGSEQLLFHIHAHLTVYVDGQARQIPYGIGIRKPQTEETPRGPFVGGGSCFYWLHTHAADGIIHIESPVRRTFTLGDFFDVWGQSLTPDRVGPIRGRVTIIYNGRVYRASPRDVPLTAHAQIQLEVGRPLVSPVRIAFPAGL
jgi:hypothetical protein